MNAKVARNINRLVTEIPGFDGDLSSNHAKRLKKKIWNNMSEKEKKIAWARLED